MSHPASGTVVMDDTIIPHPGPSQEDIHTSFQPSGAGTSSSSHRCVVGCLLGCFSGRSGRSGETWRRNHMHLLLAASSSPATSREVMQTGCNQSSVRPKIGHRLPFWVGFRGTARRRARGVSAAVSGCDQVRGWAPPDHLFPFFDWAFAFGGRPFASRCHGACKFSDNLVRAYSEKSNL